MLCYSFFALFLCITIVRRTFHVLLKIRENRQNLFSVDEIRKEPVKALIVAGSGGHTTEVIRLVSHLSTYYSPRVYVVANTDKMSEQKIQTMEKLRKDPDKHSIVHIPRSREVSQSWLSTVLSTLYAFCYSFPLVYKHHPELILCTGPGTCIPICLSGFILKFLGLHDVKIVFVESICRVNTMSLSGRILYHWADHVLVQWPELKKKYPHTEYIGRLV